MMLRAVAVSGSPRAPSKSKTLAELMLAAMARVGCAPQMIDVAALPSEALCARASAPEMDDALASVAQAHIVVAASPTYRALYTGVMKSFFDLMPHGYLGGKVCVPIHTAGSPQHFLTIDYGMRPLFVSLDGLPVAGVYATDDQFVDGQPIDKLLARIETVAQAAVSLARANAV